MTWTDERLGERFDSIDRRFDELDRRFDEVDRKFEAIDRKFEAVDRKFEAVDQRFDRVESEVSGLRVEMHAGFVAIQGSINRFSIATIAGLLGVIAAILAKGG